MAYSVSPRLTVYDGARESACAGGCAGGGGMTIGGSAEDRPGRVVRSSIGAGVRVAQPAITTERTPAARIRERRGRSITRPSETQNNVICKWARGAAWRLTRDRKAMER